MKEKTIARTQKKNQIQIDFSDYFCKFVLSSKPFSIVIVVVNIRALYSWNMQ